MADVVSTAPRRDEYDVDEQDGGEDDGSECDVVVPGSLWQREDSSSGLRERWRSWGQAGRPSNYLEI